MKSLALVLVFAVSTTVSFTVVAAKPVTPEWVALNPAQTRLNECMATLKAPLGASFSADVIRVGADFRRREGRDMRQAIVLMSWNTVSGKTVVLRPISNKALRASTEAPVEIDAESVLTVDLTDREFDHFQSESQLVGSIQVSFEKSKNPLAVLPARTPRAEDMYLGAVLLLDGHYYVVVGGGTGQHTEPGLSTSRTTHLFTLAAFDGKPAVDAGTDSDPRVLEIGAFWRHALDGKEVKTIAIVGDAVIDVHQRINREDTGSFSAKIVDVNFVAADAHKVFATAVEARDFQHAEQKQKLSDVNRTWNEAGTGFVRP